MMVYVVAKYMDGKIEKVGAYTDRVQAEEAMLNAAYEANGRWVCLLMEEVEHEEKVAK
jgi:hypothetical protein